MPDQTTQLRPTYAKIITPVGSIYQVYPVRVLLSSLPPMSLVQNLDATSNDKLQQTYAITTPESSTYTIYIVGVSLSTLRALSIGV